MQIQHILFKVIAFFVLAVLPTADIKATFGYMDYSTFNVGDDIQSIAAKKLLPKNRIPVNREFVHNYHPPCDTVVHTIMNGWFMHTKQAGWPYPNLTAPEKSWPPAVEIDPLFISFHLTKSFIPEALTEEGIQYLMNHGPIGARDYWTFEELTKRNIPSYFSGCLTLTLENTENERDDIIYAVDLDNQLVEYIKAQANCPVESIGHIISSEMSKNKSQRLAYAQTVLKKYRRARCVITSRLHAAMPCLAYKTPVLLINTQPDQYRFSGLKELTHNCTREQFLKGETFFDFNHPPENPPDYLSLRENLIKKVKQWVNSIQSEEKEAKLDSPPSLHILIATIGRSSLLQMLDSLQPQLNENDYLTIIFDATDQAGVYSEVEEYLVKFKCTCSLHMETQNLGFWGHGIRNKYNLLKGDFIMHADDDDAYTEDALDTIRKECTDTNTLYIFTMQDPEGRIAGKKPVIYLGNIGTPMGVIPSTYNPQSTWKNNYGGDFSFYNGLQNIIPHVKFIDHVIYLTRPQLTIR
jgi:hypothetical protein